MNAQIAFFAAAYTLWARTLSPSSNAADIEDGGWKNGLPSSLEAPYEDGGSGEAKMPGYGRASCPIIPSSIPKSSGTVSGVTVSQRTALPTVSGTFISLSCRPRPFLVSLTII